MSPKLSDVEPDTEYVPIAKFPVTVMAPESLTARPWSLEGVNTTVPTLSLVVMAETMDASLVVSTDWLVTEVCRMVLGPPLPTVTESVLDPLLEKTPSVAVNWALAL